MFDCYIIDQPDLPFVTRFDMLSKYNNNYIKSVDTYAIKYSFDQSALLAKINKYYNKFIDNGYEGVMIRLNGVYEQKRSMYLYKYKMMLDREFVVLDIYAGEGTLSDVAASALIEIEYSKQDRKDYTYLPKIKQQCKVNITGTMTIRKEYLYNKNDYIGKLATIRFQEYIPESGLLRFGELIAFREYE
jgi:ATP-dependent DNA ligase